MNHCVVNDSDKYNDDFEPPKQKKTNTFNKSPTKSKKSHDDTSLPPSPRNVSKGYPGVYGDDRSLLHDLLVNTESVKNKYQMRPLTQSSGGGGRLTPLQTFVN